MGVRACILGSTIFRSNRAAQRAQAGHAPRRRALYITKLPKAEHDAPESQAAMQALMLVAEHTDQRCSRGSEWCERCTVIDRRQHQHPRRKRAV
jgi:hypothetical protein